jgi:hypothetical protein
MRGLHTKIKRCLGCKGVVGNLPLLIMPFYFGEPANSLQRTDT